jgi:EmrB/QacA subfamily drug resistance transporter
MTTPASTTASARGGAAAPPSRRWLMLGLLSLAQLMLLLDVTVVNVALPAIGAHLHLDRPTLTWVLTAYTLAFGGLMLLGGRLADLLGARRVMLTGLAVFTGASLLSGLATNSAMLLGGRAAQGIGAALLSPAALSLVTTTFTGSERTKALGIWAAIGGAGSAIGVLAGGVLTSAAGWRWIFFINVPAGVLVLAVLPALVAGGRARTGRAMVDVPGALAVTAATGAAIYGLISAGSHGWLTARTLAPLGAAIVLYAVFAVIEHTVAAPLMDLRMLARRPVAAGAFLMLVGTGLLVGAFFLGSFYLQQHQHYSALHTGLLFLPVVAAIIAGAQAASYAVGRLDGRVLASCAFVLAAADAAVAAHWLGTITLVTGMSIAAVGIGAILVTATTTALARIGADEAGVGSGIVNTFHELGGAIGVAAVSSIAAPSLLAAAVSTAGFTRAFSFNAIAALAAAVLAAAVVPAGRASAGTAPTKPTRLRVNTDEGGNR